MKKRKKKKQKGSESAPTAPGEKTIVTNRKARHEYHLMDRFEAGMVLVGTEVKSLRQGKASLQEAFATVENGEVWLRDMHISPYEQGSHWNHDPKRPRKLLLHASEIRRLIGKVQERGFTLIPLRLYFKRGVAKVELALAKGKKFYDKREDMKEKDLDREAEAARKQY